MQEKRIHTIFDRFLKGTANQTDLHLLTEYFQEPDNESLKAKIRLELEKQDSDDTHDPCQPIVNRVQRSLRQARVLELQAKQENASISSEEIDELHGHLEHLSEHLVDKPTHTAPAVRPVRKKVRGIEIERPVGRRLRSAGLIASGIVAVFLIFIWTAPKHTELMPQPMTTNELVLPDSNQARVVFADGQSVSVLDGNPKLLNEKGIEVIRLPDQKIAFKINSIPDQELSYHTFISPKGNVSQLILPDNSHVWLNSDTQLTYPSHFLGGERRVDLTGEAYFEIHHDASSPFTVTADGTQVLALGTAFNVATNIKQDYVLTTLIDGSVSIGTDVHQMLIQPGMQSASSKHSGRIRSYEVDIRDELAWKAGFFRFNNDDIHAVMNKLTTWYGIAQVDIRVETTDRFSGTLRRTRKLSALLESLENISAYKFKIKDRRILIMN